MQPAYAAPASQGRVAAAIGLAAAAALAAERRSCSGTDQSHPGTVAGFLSATILSGLLNSQKADKWAPQQVTPCLGPGADGGVHLTVAPKSKLREDHVPEAVPAGLPSQRQVRVLEGFTLRHNITKALKCKLADPLCCLAGHSDYLQTVAQVM